MPVMKEVTVTYGGKLNLGDFNSAHIETTLTALPEEGETAEQVATTLLAAAKQLVQTEARRMYAKRNARVDEIFAGLPVEVRNQIQPSPKDTEKTKDTEVSNANSRIN